MKIGKPKIGEYNSGDTIAIDQHTEWLRNAGGNFSSISCDVFSQLYQCGLV